MGFNRYLMRLLGAAIVTVVIAILIRSYVGTFSLWPAFGIGLILFLITGGMMVQGFLNVLLLVIATACAAWNAAFVSLTWTAVLVMNKDMPLVAFGIAFFTAGIVAIIVSLHFIRSGSSGRV